jgi:UDP-N-acetylglucosamine 2-epimerase (non-hydrolysing)
MARVEAGMRSRDISTPEEINRLCTDAISDLLFTTDRGSVKNLPDGGIPSARIHFSRGRS